MGDFSLKHVNVIPAKQAIAEWAKSVKVKMSC